MHLKTLTKEKIKLLQKQSCLESAENCYLAGGTALALHLGHRTSQDLDWFSNKCFDEKVLIRELKSLGSTDVRKDSEQTIRAYYNLIETSFIAKPGIGESVQNVNISGIKVRIATIEQIAMMKILAICNRGYKRDFIDVYAIVKSGKMTIEQIMECAYQIGIHQSQLKRAIKYFEDADNQPDPQGLIYDWKEVRKYFVNLT